MPNLSNHQLTLGRARAYQFVAWRMKAASISVAISASIQGDTWGFGIGVFNGTG